MFPFSVEIYFYKAFIFHWLIQGKHGQDLIECFSPDFIQEIKTIISASYRLQILNWMPRVEDDLFSNSFCILHKLNWRWHAEAIEVHNFISFYISCNPMRSVSNFIIQINYATSCFVKVIF